MVTFSKSYTINFKPVELFLFLCCKINDPEKEQYDPKGDEEINFELAEDLTGSEFYLYYKAWYRLLHEVKKNYPQTFLEACAAGSMRNDIHTAMTFDGHFLSDNTNAWDMQAPGAGWDEYERITPEFACQLTMAGPVGLNGNSVVRLCWIYPEGSLWKTE